MAKYDWAKLKREYMLGDYKSLRSFAIDKGIPYTQHFRNSTQGWADEHKRKANAKQAQITEDVTEREIQYEIDRNAAHLAAGDVLLAKTNIAIQSINAKDKNALYKLERAANTLATIQKTQRLGEETSKPKDNGILPDIMRYLQRDNN